MRFILDTDHVSLLLRGNELLQERVEAEGRHVGTTVITVQEQFNGWTVKINGAPQTTDFVDLYEQLWRSMVYFQQTPVLKFDAAADVCLKQLLQQYPELRKSRLQRDMRIAAIALSLDATVVTRNLQDFGLVPGLAIVDWSV